MFYHYFSKFSLKSEKITQIELVELDKPKLNFLNVYFLMIAGGTMHNYLDSIINRGGVFPMTPEISLTIQNFMDLWYEPAVEVNLIFSAIVGIMFIFGFIFIFVWFLKNYSLQNLIFPLIYITGFLILFHLTGSVTTLFHSDAGAIFYVFLIWLPVMGGISLSVKEFSHTRKDKKRFNLKERPKTLLNFISAWFLMGAIVLFFGSLLGLIFNEAIITWLFNEWGTQIEEYLTFTQVMETAIGLEVFLLCISALNFICTFGLIIRNRTLWRITIYYQFCISWTLIGLFIACLLSKDSIKTQFNY